ncbi:hypothetical protein HZH68_014963 [Vespula germanica]|uniref:Uncharacterized protein n=1 Tax=Vespula germanica TaxID=30212 RepID=A0A834J9X8_VESGE|nr:hypothetical protein HZH68_014963 [Vespula germanica]
MKIIYRGGSGASVGVGVGAGAGAGTGAGTAVAALRSQPFFSAFLLYTTNDININKLFVDLESEVTIILALSRCCVGHDKRSSIVEFVLLFEIRKARTVVLNSGVCSCRCWDGPVIRKRGLTLFQIALGTKILEDHAGHADFSAESPLACGSPDAATSTW